MSESAVRHIPAAAPARGDSGRGSSLRSSSRSRREHYLFDWLWMNECRADEFPCDEVRHGVVRRSAPGRRRDKEQEQEQLFFLFFFLLLFARSSSFLPRFSRPLANSLYLLVVCCCWWWWVRVLDLIGGPTLRLAAVCLVWFPSVPFAAPLAQRLTHSPTRSADTTSRSWRGSCSVSSYCWPSQQTQCGQVRQATVQRNNKRAVAAARGASGAQWPGDDEPKGDAQRDHRSSSIAMWIDVMP